MRRLIFIKVCYLILRAWLYRRGGIKQLRLPGVHPGIEPDAKTVDETVARVDSILNLALRNTQHICFYRSYVLAVILRQMGLPVVLNVGGRALWSSEIMKAHCWLSLGGVNIYEKENAFDLYPLEMGYNSDRSIRYWIGEEFDRSVLEEEGVCRNYSAGF